MLTLENNPSYIFHIPYSILHITFSILHITSQIMKQSEIIIRVPATSANLGPGFDCLGVALTLYNEFEFTLADSNLIKGCSDEFAGKDNLTLRAFRAAAEEIGLPYQGITIDHRSAVPFTRGLGSSSTCIVAGVAAAFAFMEQANDKARILDIATRIEGHPDNVAPAIYGGFTACMMEQGHPICLPIANRNDYRFFALVPPFTLSTTESRQVLPTQISRQDATYNLSHAVALTTALTNGQDNLLRIALQDRLHQPYRGKLIPNYDAILQRLSACPDILGAYLSGAGPTLMAITKPNTSPDFPTLLTPLIPDWQILSLQIDYKGFTLNS